MAYNLKTIKQEFKDKGIYYTPPELAEKLKSYAPPNITEVYDPTCGDGSLLSVFGDDVKKYGQEINEDQCEVARNKLKNSEIHCGDTLKNPALLGKKFDCIVANPPFSLKWEPKLDERFQQVPAIPTKGKADYAFILHILYYLSVCGKAIILNAPGILYRGSKEGQIRKWLVDNNYIERIVSIPGDTFVDTKISTILLILSKNKENTDIVFEDEELNKEVSISLQKIIDNDYVLSFNNYIEKEIVKEYINPIELNYKARKNMIDKLEKDIKIDFMVCELEKIDKNEYIDTLIAKLQEIKSSL